jgi:hypothetical protein
MGRRNHRQGRPQARRQQRAGVPAAPPLEALVIPRGRCFRNSRKGKLRFTKDDAPKALEQARIKRARTGSLYTEERFYECKEAEGGCGDYHLTSRSEYNERGQG